MTEDEIKDLAASLGLDPAKLTIREPFLRNNDLGKFKQYRFEYESSGTIFDYNFVLPEKDIIAGHESVAVKFYVNKGLRELAAKFNQ